MVGILVGLGSLCFMLGSGWQEFRRLPLLADCFYVVNLSEAIVTEGVTFGSIFNYTMVIVWQ